MPKNKVLASAVIDHPHPTKTSKRQKFIQDLEEVFHAAFDAGKFSAALRAKELQMKKSNESALTGKNLSEILLSLSQADLKSLLTEMEKQVGEKTKQL
jgi:hypothetical protein